MGLAKFHVSRNVNSSTQRRKTVFFFPRTADILNFPHTQSIPFPRTEDFGENFHFPRTAGNPEEKRGGKVKMS